MMLRFTRQAAFCVLGCSTAVLIGCTVGPNYRRPTTNVPPAYRDAPSLSPTTGATDSADLGRLAWEQVFTDPNLQKLERTALSQNQDLAITAARIEQARATLHLARLQDYPAVHGQANFTDERLSQEGLPGDKVTGPAEGSATQGSLNLGWEIDFWGRYRREREAARARLLSTEAAQQAVRISLIAEVARAYFQLLEYDSEMKAAQQSLKLRQESLRLTQARERGGVSSLLDVRQAQTLVTEARQMITNLNRLIPQRENELSMLLGKNPGPIPRGLPLSQNHIPTVPPGMPSQLLERRPDIRQMEEDLHAANADVGVVRAEYFPNIGLTSSVGTASSAVHNLFTGGATNWLIQPTISVPIFTAGRIHAHEKQARAAVDAALHAYLATVQQAFREVSDALIARQEAHRYREEQDTQVKNAEDAAFLSRARYKGGITNYLEVLETERTSLEAKLNLAQAKYAELDASVRLYRALGGGWRP